MQVDRDDRGHAAGDGIAAGENAAVEGAAAERHHPFGLGRRALGPLQRLAHVLRDRPGHQQHVGMARRGDEAQAEPLEIVERVAERMDFELAAVARAGIDLADRQAAAEARRAARSTPAASSASAASSGAGAASVSGL